MNMEFAREQMLTQQLRAWDVLNDDVLHAVGSVPREAFVPPEYRSLAFADTAIPLRRGQEMMAPKIEGRLLQALELKTGDRVLEIGTGSGFVTACLARLAAHVHSIDLFADFVDEAGERLQAHGIGNAQLEVRDAFDDTWAPGTFDAIAVTGSLPVLDERFVQWLKPGGRLFAVVGQAPVMQALRITRGDDGRPQHESLFETQLPALLNAPRPSPFRL